MAHQVSQTPVYNDLDSCVDLAIERVGKELILGAPLGLGKPVQLLNAFYARARRDPSIHLHIYTALSLEVPVPAAGIESSLAGPIVERLFGDYEGLSYLPDMRAGSLPDNIRVSELYVKAGSMKGVAAAQQAYISSNYTHIARDMVAAGVNVLCQLLAFRERNGKLELSLSSNPDTSLDMLKELEERTGGAYVALGQLHPDLPFMEHDAVVAPERFSALARNRAWDRRLFAVPNAAVPASDYATAMHASALVMDGGTLQIGIGSLGDAVAQTLILRHSDNSAYQELMRDAPLAPEGLVQTGVFDSGLYVSTEMFVNGMMHLIEQGIVKRRVYDNLTLQRGLNSGAISEVIDDRLFDYARERGLLPRTLDQDSLDALKHLGLIDGGLALDASGRQLVRGDDVWANDTDDPATRTALLSVVKGRRLRSGRFLHGGFFLGPADFYAKLRA
ncbi:MAG: acetyl-CoA hydrolase, partial [Pseudomonadota bacterium]